jgi:autotransporter-associated beta strand protein
MKPRFFLFPLLSLALSPSVIAADIIWKGTTDSTWTDGTNWLDGIAPAYGSDLSSDRLVIGNGTDFGAVYNPPGGETTTFGSGRGIIIGSTTQGPANLTVSSGTLKINGTGGDNPIMANGVSASVVINGGNLDISGHPVGFRLCGLGATGLTSELTISNGSFSSGTFDFFTAGTEGTSTVNLNSGGVLAVTRFLKGATATASTLNIDGGTLRARNTQTSPNLFLADLAGLQTIVKAGGVVIDSNTFDMTIAEVLEHDSLLDPLPDGGLTKNGAGTLSLSGANTFNGGLTVNAGTNLTPAFNRVTLNNDSAAGTGTITLADSYAEIRLFGTTGRSIANPIVISNTGDEKTLIFTQTGTATCSGPITINETTPDHFRVRVDSSTLTLSGKISGAGGINKYAGTSALQLTDSTNDFTGGARITAGTLDFASGALGTSGSIIMDGGFLRWGTGNTDDISGRIVMVDAKNAVFSTNGNDVTFATAIGNSSTGNFAKSTTSGTLTLNGTNTYTGTTSVGGGTLLVNGSLDAASAVTVTGGNLGGTGTIGGSVTIAASGSLAPGASAGTLTINGGLDISAMAGGAGKLKFELAALAGTNDQVTVGGALALGDLALDDLEVTNLGGLQAGTYTLVTSTGLTGTVDTTPAEIAAGFNGQLNINGNNLELVVTAASAGFAAWQSANSTAGGLGDDHDGDGVDNGTEWFLGGNNDTTGFTALPGVVNTLGTLSVTWVRHPDYPGFPGNYGTDFLVETSTSLATGSWVTAPQGTNPGEVEITGDNVKFTFPAGTKNFARLKITGP